ncbi:OPT superfamily oligopeptide transporter [Fistulina hepatica ATCC 64428]|uniref:OPT superfamily oligopeptide transporter n=1 Tax=Fistulina hepatica ATCC 64428 TaxID=1128425 RepID=A0A0D7AHI3_9AGAR|nr:OPT superfamily oligopeptide transporter [Fistulina hepatica ATCC 64428]
MTDVAPLSQVTHRRTSDPEKFVDDTEKASVKVSVVPEDESDVSDKVIEKAEDVATHVISTRDDPSLPSITFRSLFLGIGLSAFASVLATIYTFKPQNASVSQLFVLIIAYVLGEAMASMTPRTSYWKYINPGPFNIKEHTVIVIMSSTASNVAVGMEIIAAMDLFYDITLNPAVAIFQIFASQMLGYGMCGILRPLLVYPTYAFYPAYISVVNLLQSLHFGGALNAKRRKFFWIVFTTIFFWEWIPQYPFPLMTAISIICIADNGHHGFVRNLFGAGSSNEGIGLFSFGTSWTLITQGYPLVWPLQTLGMALGYIVLTACYYNNVFDGRNLDWMSQSLFSSNGSTYDQDAVITSDYLLNTTALEEVGLPRYTTTYAISQLTYNLSLGSAITFIFLWHWKELKDGTLTDSSFTAWQDMKFFKGGHSNVDDPHYAVNVRLSAEVPQWVYAALLFVCLGAGIGCSYAGPNGVVLMSGWAILLFTVISFFVALVLGFRFNISIKYAVQIMAAFILPGQPIAVMYANLYGNSTAFQVLYMLQDLKLAQYTKLPPRSTFFSQMAGSIIGSIFNYTMMKTIVANNREVLKNPTGTRLWSGWIIQSYNSASVAMGALGKELFTIGKPSGYWIIPFAIIIGFFLPIPFWIVHKLTRPGSRINYLAKYINVPIITLYIGYLPYSVNGQWWSCFVIGILSQWYIRTRYPRWFVKYNYLLSAGLDGGSQVILFILSFAVFGASGNAISFPYWWGNPDPDHFSVDRCAPT